MTRPLRCVVLLSDPLAQIHLCAYLHAHAPYRVVGIPRSSADLKAVFNNTTVDLMLCGGAFRLVGVKALRAELRGAACRFSCSGTTTVWQVWRGCGEGWSVVRSDRQSVGGIELRSATRLEHGEVSPDACEARSGWPTLGRIPLDDESLACGRHLRRPSHAMRRAPKLALAS